MNTIIYKESQRFNQPLLWVTLLSVYIPFHVWGIRKLLNESSKGNVLLESETVQAAVIGIVLLNFLVVLFLFIKLPKILEKSPIGGYGRLLKNKIVMLGTLGIFLYVGAEVAIGSYLVNPVLYSNIWN